MPVVFDIIFAGGGTTACVVAGRLAAADRSLKILVVESGQHSRDIPRHVQPCRYIENLAPDSTTISSHVGKPSIHLNGRAPVVPCGHSLGGGSAVNAMFYARGAASDYDDWAAFGNEGWGFNQVLPLFKKFETFNPLLEQKTHGYSGPIQISLTQTDVGIGRQFLDVTTVYDPTRSQVDDPNDFKTANAYSPCYRYVDPVTGKRSDAASRYLYPQSGNANLEIMVGKHVKRVVIEDGRAVGIEYMAVGTDELDVARASKLVIISAGAFGSPSILERSGIGAPSVLEENNVPLVINLPGVGENYQDHVGACPVFYASNETESMQEVWSNPEETNAWLKEWEENGTGKIAHNGAEAMARVRPAPAELRLAGHALQLRWETFFRYSPDKSMAMIILLSSFPVDSITLQGRKSGLSAAYYLLYPESVGSVHITSGEDPSPPLDFNPDFFSKAGDVEQLTLLYKMARELVRRMPCYRGEVAAHHPKFAPDSTAACKETDGPVLIDAPDIVYSDADNEAIMNFHRDNVSTTWHSLGTCAMKPRDQGGVVDARLNVYGVEGLKIADLSICPTNVGNNTYSTALLIGEKAAAIIVEDLDITTTRRKPSL